jgi:hypothetical protein
MERASSCLSSLDSDVTVVGNEGSRNGRLARGFEWLKGGMHKPVYARISRIGERVSQTMHRQLSPAPDQPRHVPGAAMCQQETFGRGEKERTPEFVPGLFINRSARSMLGAMMSPSD